MGGLHPCPLLGIFPLSLCGPLLPNPFQGRLALLGSLRGPLLVSRLGGCRSRLRCRSLPLEACGHLAFPCCGSFLGSDLLSGSPLLSGLLLRRPLLSDARGARERLPGCARRRA